MSKSLSPSMPSSALPEPPAPPENRRVREDRIFAQRGTSGAIGVCGFFFFCLASGFIWFVW